jgi:hypothetical protein
LTTASADYSPDLLQGVALLRQIFPKESSEELKQLHRSHIRPARMQQPPPLPSDHPPANLDGSSKITSTLPASTNQTIKDDTIMTIPIHDMIVFLPGSAINESPPRSHHPLRPFKQSFELDEDAELRKNNHSKRVELKKDGLL